MRLIHIVPVLLALACTPLHAQNLVINGEFDESLIGWVNSSDTEMTAVWSPADSNGSLESGSMRVTNLSPGASNGVVASQCVPVNSGQSYTYGGKVRIPSGAVQDITNQAVMSLRWYSGPDCTTPNGGSITAGASPQNFDQWVSQTATATARSGARSVEVRTLLSKFPAGGSFIAHFDDIILTTPSIFQNGFD
jgi:hypothetical protein